MNCIWLGLNEFGFLFIDKVDELFYFVIKVNLWGINLDVCFFYDIKVINGNYWFVINEGIYVIIVLGKIF